MSEPVSQQLAEFARRLGELELRVAQEAGLRASADRDLADMAQTLRAHQMSIQALSITQAQHNNLLRDQGELLEQVVDRLDRHSEVLTSHGLSLAASHDKLDQIIGLLTSLSGDEGQSGQ